MSVNTEAFKAAVREEVVELLRQNLEDERAAHLARVDSLERLLGYADGARTADLRKQRGIDRAAYPGFRSGPSGAPEVVQSSQTGLPSA